MATLAGVLTVMLASGETDPVQHWAAVVAIVVGLLTIAGMLFAASRWLDRKNTATIKREVTPIVTEALRPIRDAQASIKAAQSTAATTLEAHMRDESAVLARHVLALETQVRAHEQHVADDKRFQAEITERLDRDYREGHEERSLMLGLLRDALQARVNPHPEADSGRVTADPEVSP